MWWLSIIMLLLGCLLLVLTTHVVNGAIAPTPSSIFPFPSNTGIVSIGLTRGASTLVVATSSHVHIIDSPIAANMTLIASTNFTGEFRCLLVGAHGHQIDVVTSMNGMGSKQLVSNVYHLHTSSSGSHHDSNTNTTHNTSAAGVGTLALVHYNNTYFPVKHDSITCTNEPHRRSHDGNDKSNSNSNGTHTNIGYYLIIGDALHFLTQSPPSPSPSLVHRYHQQQQQQQQLQQHQHHQQLLYVSRPWAFGHRLGEMIVIPAAVKSHHTNKHYHEPSHMLLRTDSQADETFQQFLLPKPDTPKKVGGNPRGYYGPNYINLYDEPSLPSLGWLISTLENRGGVMVKPYNFEGFTWLTNDDPIIDRNTIYHPSQKLIVVRAGACVYIVGPHRDSFTHHGLVTLTQWTATSAIRNPFIVDQAVVKLHSDSPAGVISMRVGTNSNSSSTTGTTSSSEHEHGEATDDAPQHHVIYIADDQHIYRFTAQCPSS